MLDGLTAGLLARSDLWPDVCYLLFAIVVVESLGICWIVRYGMRALERCEERRRESEAARIADAAAERERWAESQERQAERNLEFIQILTRATETMSRLEFAMNRPPSAPSGRSGL